MYLQVPLPCLYLCFHHSSLLVSSTALVHNSGFVCVSFVFSHTHFLNCQYWNAPLTLHLNSFTVVKFESIITYHFNLSDYHISCYCCYPPLILLFSVDRYIAILLLLLVKAAEICACYTNGYSGKISWKFDICILLTCMYNCGIVTPRTCST